MGTHTPARVAESDKPRASKGRKIAGGFFTVVGVVVALALIVAGFYAWRIWTTMSDLERTDTLLPSAEDTTRPASDAAVEGSFNYVLMGSDSRGEGDQGRSDVLMLAHVPPARDKVYLISFPRDMWVNIPGHGSAKINAAYAWGGDALTTKTLESLVGVRMNHAVKIDFDGFIGLTSELDGVTLYNRVASEAIAADGSYRYTWPQGELTLQGEEALAYVRQRYELPQGDLDRAERQRAVVKAIVQKLLSRDVLANPATFNEVAGSLGQYFMVDDELTNEAIFSTATSMRVNGSEDIVMLQAHISGFGRSADGQAIDVVDEAQLEEMAHAIQTGHMDEYAAKYKDQPYVG